MRTIGDRLAELDKTESTVADFNRIFDDVPLTRFKDTDTVLVGEITKNATTRQLLINNVAIEHSFERRLTSENEIIITDDNVISDDDFWMCQFV
jgi:hypothetical protein